MMRRARGGSGRLTVAAAALAAAGLGVTGGAQAAVPHVVQSGETLWGIAVAHNLTTRTVAVFNGLPEDAHLIAGQTIQVPTVEEGAAALAAAAPASVPTASDATYGLGHIPSPWGELHLDPAAASSWNAMREASLAQFGVDLYPAGPLSAHRTYEQQAQLYELYLLGQGPLAAPPGSSAHERGVAVDVAEPIMREIIDRIGAAYGWGKVDAAEEWWHVSYLGG
jgi:LAS superfamily LD-carboxypeptidase LdcB